ncbi:AMP-binding protein [Falsibacillus albus]|uniref:Acyl-CoA synthetase n=1 Tax=Falsibacillus albus TaxID=2478915 RepID=A0A3L7K3C4_9BACI|nr:AMP-binding protein [Falsibacillus albus]RLQ97330.1 hypothetical protein D9X91_04055 [Falsibacillus albus]
MYIGENLKTISALYPNKPAIIQNHKIITYKNFNENVEQVRNRLYSHFNGSQEKRKIAFRLKNSAAFLEVFFGVASMGWTAVPLDSKWTQNELKHAIGIAEPDLIILEDEASDLLHLFPVSSVINLSAIYQQSPEAVAQTFANEHDSFYLGFTSGTTGLPKGFIRSHRSWVKSFEACEEAFGYGREEAVIAPGPLVHSLSLFAAAHCLHCGGTFYLESAFLPETVFNLLKNNSIDVISAVPTMLEALLSVEANPGQKLVGVKKILVSGAQWQEDSKLRVMRLFPEAELYEYYGASELSFVSYNRFGMGESDGGQKLFSDVQISVINEHGVSCGSEEIGRIYISSPMLFSGYVNNVQETKKVLTPMGATVGDLGFLDNNGALTVVGRENNMIKSGGLKIFPEEVEGVLKGIVGIKEAVVVGVQDAYWGEMGVAVIQWENEEEKLLPEEMKRRCLLYLSSYKCPKNYLNIDAFPMTKSGKVDRSAMKKWTEVKMK